MSLGVLSKISGLQFFMAILSLAPQTAATEVTPAFFDAMISVTSSPIYTASSGLDPVLNKAFKIGSGCGL